MLSRARFEATAYFLQESDPCISGCGPAFERPLRAASGQPVTICIKQATPCRLTVSLSADVAQPDIATLKQKVLSYSKQKHIQAVATGAYVVVVTQHRPAIDSSHVNKHMVLQVVRMLRLDKEGQETVKGFHAVHALAKQEGFGRLFRSPTIWEDLVKCILLCNCG